MELQNEVAEMDELAQRAWEDILWAKAKVIDGDVDEEEKERMVREVSMGKG